MSPFITTLIVIAGVIIALVIKTNKNNKKKQAPDDQDDYHLGEMTLFDVPPTFKKTEKERIKWSSRQLKEAESQRTRKKEKTNETGFN
jgi:hypothetical protein